MKFATWGLVVSTAFLASCGGDDAPKPTTDCKLGAFDDGDATGNAAPLAADATQARAGRLKAADLTPVPSGMITWQAGDFVLANDHVALVIEDAGPSDLYDPWGGRPVGVARVEGGKMVEPANFGEFFLLTGRSTVVTEAVTVLNDGSDGQPAVIRARGKLHPLPFFESVIGVVYHDKYTDVEAAIDYSLAPGADHVDITMHYMAPRTDVTKVPSTLHAFMYTKRTPMFQTGKGFDEGLENARYVALVDDNATSWAYIPGEGTLGTTLATSGFVGAFSAGFDIPACEQLDRLHARLVIGKSLDGTQLAAETLLGTEMRTVSGTVMRGGQPVANAHVHAAGADGGELTRVSTDATGAFTLHVPTSADVTLSAFRRGDSIGTDHVGAGATSSITLPATGTIDVAVSDGTNASPARIQIFAAGSTELPIVPDKWGEDPIANSRLHVVYSIDGTETLTVPPGQWEVVVSRGYEYEISRQTVTVAAGATVHADATLDHVVDTTGVQCADTHIHTWRSNDSGDRAIEKLKQAVADGLEIPVRSDHEWVGDFATELTAIGAEKYARAFGSIELTSFQVWGHMGVFPLTADPTQVNAGAPKWQTFPTADAPDTAFETLSPKAVFEAVRARPEAPVVIINHPRSPTDYFGYVGLDPATGIVSDDMDWDTKFTLVEVFNDSGWKANLGGTVKDWLSLLKAGRHVFATGASDSHGISTSPVGYPRTCITVGTDDPRALTANQVRDGLAAGHSVVSGGIYVSAKLGTAGPGDTTTGAGSMQMVDVEVQAASWIDVDAIDVVVDGDIVDTIPVMPADAQGPTIRYHAQVPVQVRATGGFIVIAAYAAKALDPIHPGRIPFGVTNPIFVNP
ncbi:MAG TPA: CehA/McbA family metallohydrolase [Kofleriaceae bacterium]